MLKVEKYKEKLMESMRFSLEENLRMEILIFDAFYKSI